jgi:Cu(I)/Ag(I) efflux system membrane fusion protein
MKIKNPLLLLTFLAFLFVQCGGSKQETEGDEQVEHASGSEAAAAATGPQFEVDQTFREQLSRTLQGYLKVKDAFVASDAAAVKAEAAGLKAMLKSMDAKMLTGPALNDWSNYANNLDMALAEITGSDDIEVQRTAFSQLSDNLYKSIKAYGLGGMTAYYEFCPMAFNDQGAYWLSDSKEIRNPYFGDKMLKCGRVTEELN